MSTDYSLWAEAKTKHGLAVDEVVSGLQKAIRRSMVELACRYAYELYTTSPVLLEKVWSRLLTISVEDVGFGNLDASRHMYILNEMRKNYAYDDVDQPMYFIHAIRILCASQKDRSSDFLKNIVIKTAAMGEVPEIIDIALDKHTKRGKEMGRDSKHFYEEGSKVIPQMDIDNDYRERYGKILETYDPEKVEKDAFRYAVGRV
ncbi:hypothetical protein [[Eubacterium] hominis]|uniref:hypothetical protein n=1 Tax=[Eubacterium] hominis TaxID=2764325 RepID=UPI003A4E1474